MFPAPPRLVICIVPPATSPVPVTTSNNAATCRFSHRHATAETTRTIFSIISAVAPRCAEPEVRLLPGRWALAGCPAAAQGLPGDPAGRGSGRRSRHGLLPAFPGGQGQGAGGQCDTAALPGEPAEPGLPRPRPGTGTRGRRHHPRPAARHCLVRRRGSRRAADARTALDHARAAVVAAGVRRCHRLDMDIPAHQAAGGRTRLHLRVRGRTAPRWLTAAYLGTIIPADYIMAMGMLHHGDGHAARPEEARRARAGRRAQRGLARTGRPGSAPGTMPESRTTKVPLTRTCRMPAEGRVL